MAVCFSGPLGVSNSVQKVIRLMSDPILTIMNYKNHHNKCCSIFVPFVQLSGRLCTARTQQPGHGHYHGQSHGHSNGNCHDHMGGLTKVKVVKPLGIMVFLLPLGILDMRKALF